MKSKIIEFKDLSESREVIEHKVTNFMLIFFYFLLVLVAAVLIWSYFGKKELVVQSGGMVQAHNVQVITPLSNEVVFISNFNEGDFVNKGDLIMAFDSSEVRRELIRFEDMLDEHNDKVVLAQKYFDSVKQDENLFSLDNHNEIEKYYEVEAHLELLAESTTPDKTKNMELVSALSSIEQYENTIVQIDNEIIRVQATLEGYYFYAQVNGVIHFIRPLSVGTALQAGQEVIKIFETNDEHLIIQIFVLNKDITKINIGQDIRVEIPALSAREFGFASANVIAIESTSRVDQQSGQSFFIVIAY